MRAPRQPPLSPRRRQPRTWTGRQAGGFGSAAGVVPRRGFRASDDRRDRERASLLEVGRFLEEATQHNKGQLLPTLRKRSSTPAAAWIPTSTSYVVGAAETMGRMTPTCFSDVLAF